MHVWGFSIGKLEYISCFYCPAATKEQKQDLGVTIPTAAASTIKVKFLRLAQFWEKYRC